MTNDVIFDNTKHKSFVPSDVTWKIIALKRKLLFKYNCSIDQACYGNADIQLCSKNASLQILDLHWITSIRVRSRKPILQSYKIVSIYFCLSVILAQNFKTYQLKCTSTQQPANFHSTDVEYLQGFYLPFKSLSMALHSLICPLIVTYNSSYRFPITESSYGT